MMYLLIKKCTPEELYDVQRDIHELPNQKEAYVIMNNKLFLKYIDKHGYHFSERLSDYASRMMENNDNTDHHWTSEQVRNALVSLGDIDFNMSTIGDLAYLANMAYADFYPNVLKDETACIKYAYAVAHDKDGYDGIVFSRWLADIIGKHITDIKWENYI